MFNRFVGLFIFPMILMSLKTFKLAYVVVSPKTVNAELPANDFEPKRALVVERVLTMSRLFESTLMLLDICVSGFKTGFPLIEKL